MSSLIFALVLVALLAAIVWRARATTTPFEIPGEMPLIAAEDNPWGVELIDLRPYTSQVVALTESKEAAANALSYGSSDGVEFAEQALEHDEEHSLDLEYPIDGFLRPGVLFLPAAMENKWALFFHDDRILFVRSWQRQVVLRVDTEQSDRTVRLKSARGRLAGRGETADLVGRWLDFLLRSHALSEPWPIPLRPGDPVQRGAETAVLFALFGNLAELATWSDLDPSPPHKPLRTNSSLHIAVARDDRETVARLLAAGWPLELRAADGLGLLDWAPAAGVGMLRFLLEHGAEVDFRTDQGTTPLMTATQSRDADAVEVLLEAGADPSASDSRGFTSLHRAAEMGELEIVERLLEAGAAPDPRASGHTPLSLAEQRDHSDIVERLRSAGA